MKHPSRIEEWAWDITMALIITLPVWWVVNTTIKTIGWAKTAEIAIEALNNTEDNDD